MKRVTRLIIILSSLLATACGGGGGGGGGGGEGGGAAVSQPDFANSLISSVGVGLADGTTDYTITVTLKNSDNTFVSGFTPLYIVTLPASTTAASDVTTSSCTSSDSNGLSYCRIKASTAGDKLFKLLNVSSGLERTVTFANVSASAENLQTVSSGGSGLADQSGYKVSGSVGLVFSGQKSISNGYTIYHSIQGQAGSTSP